MKKWKALSGILCFVLLVAGCNQMNRSESSTQQKKIHANDVSSLNWKVTDFSYTDQEGKSFGTKDVKGKLWIAHFMFTRCPNVCPPMMANMVKLRKALEKEGLKIPTISFSVDPKNDTPASLKAFAEKQGADLTDWHLVTGYDQKEIQQLAFTCFKGIVEKQKQPSPDYPVLINHPTMFYLVDASGKIVRYYDGLKISTKRIVKDIRNLDSSQ